MRVGVISSSCTGEESLVLLMRSFRGRPRCCFIAVAFAALCSLAFLAFSASFCAFSTSFLAFSAAFSASFPAHKISFSTRFLSFASSATACRIRRSQSFLACSTSFTASFWCVSIDFRHPLKASAASLNTSFICPSQSRCARRSRFSADVMCREWPDISFFFTLFPLANARCHNRAFSPSISTICAWSRDSCLHATSRSACSSAF